jgi:hypothetical protein
MTHRRTRVGLALFAVAMVGATACGSHDLAGPTSSALVAKSTKTGGDTSATTEPTPSKPAPGTPSDTATKPPVPVTPPPADSGAVSSYTGIVAISGHVVVLRGTTSGSGGDTLSYQPVAGTPVTATTFTTGVTVASTTTASDGSFSLSVPAADYRINGFPPAGAGAWAGNVIVSARQPAISVQLVLQAKP